MRILLVKTSSLGDVIHNLPVASDIARALPGARIDWCVEESFAEIPALHPAVSRIIPVALRRWRKAPLTRKTWHEIGNARQQLAHTAYDRIIDTQGLVKSALIALQAQGPRCGMNADSAREPWAARTYTHTFPIPRTQHAVQRNRQLAAAALGYALMPDLDYGMPSPGQRQKTAILLSATSRDDKLWPERHWIDLGRALAACGLQALLPGGNPRERERAARIAAGIPGARALPAASLTELAGTIGSATLAVGVDTGLAHLAAALRTPTVAIFTSTDPALTGVLGSGLAVNLGGIGRTPEPEEVLAALRSGGAL